MTATENRSPDTPHTEDNPAKGRRWALLVAIGAMALTLIPYLFGLTLRGAKPSLGWYSWLGYNLDDTGVYLSWMRQAADGHFFQRNLFTTDPQLGHQFSVFFLLLGNIARFLHLPLIFVYHAARLVLGVAFLRAVWWLLELLLKSPGARRIAFLLVCFSTGLGWLPDQWHLSGIMSPVDVWQPEAITFLCLYLSPLFLVSLLLMVGVIGWLVVAMREHSLRAALYAGLCGLILGNIHTYDVITLCAIWTVYLIAQTILHRKFDVQAWGYSLVAGAFTAISSGYMLYLVKTEDVFAKRVAVPTLSPEFKLYALGYGLVLLLAIVAAVGVVRWMLQKGREEGAEDSGADQPIRDKDSALLLVVWAIVNLGIAYLPVSFNRKMLMGEHIPLAILCALALWQFRSSWRKAWWALVLLAVALPTVLLITRAPAVSAIHFIPALILICVVAGIYRNRQGDWQGSVGLAGIVMLLSLTNWLFMARDMENFLFNQGQSHIQRPFLYEGEIAALGWIKDHVPTDAPIQPLPWIKLQPDRRIGFFDTSVALFTPGLTGHQVHAGHWGETPDFGATMAKWVHFLKPNTPDEERLDLLRETGVRYLIFTQKHDETNDPETENGLLSLFRMNPPRYLRLVPEASNPDADVYEVSL
jgi:hypothetical protein